MQRYRYKHGDHPLEGYTIQRAAGRGGFGEVYYALSDSGREVAIKAVQNYEQIELRGITQCMNLKSPHLVTIFDVKYNDRGQPFVIMEYVSGPSLRTLLAESPGGLGKQKAAFFLREIAKGLSYLHECGIVHRDLKPGNIFYENGYVKVGDYGLTKAIGATRHSGHTITVGTVHYMAPEIGAGKYNFSIDIYALGVLSYEMLTGEVPFAGESPAEILMKHMSAEPELKNIEEPFAHVIKKALAKDPDERYQSVQEMVEDLFGEENIRNSVSHFSPEELSVVAQQVAAKADIGEKAQKPKTGTSAQGEANKQFADNAQNVFGRIDTMGRAIADRVDSKVDYILGAKKTRIPGLTDPIQPNQRYMLAFISALIVSVGAGFLHGKEAAPLIALYILMLINICAVTILLIQQWQFTKPGHESRWVEKLTTSFSVAVLVGFISIIFKFGHFKSIFISIFLSMFLIDWRRISLPGRRKRLSLGSALWAGILGAITGQIFGAIPILIGAVMAGTSLAVQAISSFGQAEQNIFAKHKSDKKIQFHNSLASGVVPTSLRMVWFIASLIAFGFGLFFVISGSMKYTPDDFAFGVTAGVNGLVLAIFFFIGACRSRFNGWYRYFIKPAILVICVLVIVASSIYMGCANLNRDGFAISLFLIIFPAVAFFVVMVIPARVIVGSAPKPSSTKVSPKPVHIETPQMESGISVFKRFWALLLSAGGFFGFFGLHRFYVGKIGTGILWFFTGGLFLVGQIVDVIMILSGQFEDCYGLPLLMWHEKEELGERAHFVKTPIPEYEALEQGKEPIHEIPHTPGVGTQKQPASGKPTTVVIRESFHPFAFLFSGLGSILMFLAVLLGIIVGLKIPYFIAAGWPNQQLASELERFFGYSSWPVLLMRLGTMFTYILVLLAAVFVVLGRRHLGASHLVRALLGFVALILAFSAFSDASAGIYYDDVVNLLNSQQYGPAIERLLQSWQGEETIFIALILFLVSIVILAWPPRRKQNIITASQIQGVS